MPAHTVARNAIHIEKPPAINNTPPPTTSNKCPLPGCGRRIRNPQQYTYCSTMCLVMGNTLADIEDMSDTDQGALALLPVAQAAVDEINKVMKQFNHLRWKQRNQR